MTPMTALFVLFCLSGLVFIGLGIPLVLRRVEPNHWYGFRVRRTLQDSKVWYPANVYAGWRLLWLGVAEIAVATALYLVPIFELPLYASTVGAVVVAGLIVVLLQSFAYLQRMTKNNEAEGVR